MTDNKIHHGRNIKRFRELFGIKQEALALELGDDWNQQRISLLEQKEEMDNILEEVAKALKVPIEVIKNFDKEAAVNYINSFHDNSINHGLMDDYGTYNFNPIEKWMEALEQNKQLYERLLQTEREKVAMLEKYLNERPF
jgi:transcriptional regulator with XRE-family HTH domain